MNGKILAELVSNLINEKDTCNSFNLSIGNLNINVSTSDEPKNVFTKPNDMFMLRSLNGQHRMQSQTTNQKANPRDREYVDYSESMLDEECSEINTEPIVKESPQPNFKLYNKYDLTDAELKELERFITAKVDNIWDLLKNQFGGNISSNNVLIQSNFESIGADGGWSTPMRQYIINHTDIRMDHLKDHIMRCIAYYAMYMRMIRRIEK